jgi:hypothetical protein
MSPGSAALLSSLAHLAHLAMSISHSMSGPPGPVSLLGVSPAYGRFAIVTCEYYLRTETQCPKSCVWQKTNQLISQFLLGVAFGQPRVPQSSKAL